MVCIDKIVNGLGFNNLIQVIMSWIIENGGLTKEELFKKMEWMGWMYFNAKNKSHTSNQGFMGTIFYACSFCYPYGKLGSPILAKFDPQCETLKLNMYDYFKV